MVLSPTSDLVRKRTKNPSNRSPCFGLSILLLLFHYADCSIKARCSHKRFLLPFLLNLPLASREKLPHFALEYKPLELTK